MVRSMQAPSSPRSRKSLGLLAGALLALACATQVRWGQAVTPPPPAASAAAPVENGPDDKVRAALADALYASGDYANAARQLQFEVQAAERNGRAPAEARLLLLRQCYERLGDENAAVWALEKLVTYYPSRTYWTELLDRVQKRPDFGARLALDVDRLRLLVGALHSPADYLQMAERARQAGLPSEAKKVVDAGFASGVLGTGPDAVRQRALQAELARASAEEFRRISTPQAEAAARAARDGIEMHRLGLALFMAGDRSRGLALMEAAAARGISDENKPSDAKLRLGIVLLANGDRAQAIQVFGTVGGMHGAKDLAQLWLIQARAMAR
jgi:hypothetical protein